MVISGRTLVLAVICICIALTVPAVISGDLLFPVTGRLYTRQNGTLEVSYVPNYTEGPYLTARSAVLIEATTGSCSLREE